jgi:hypothetical protein
MTVVLNHKVQRYYLFSLQTISRHVTETENLSEIVFCVFREHITEHNLTICLFNFFPWYTKKNLIDRNFRPAFTWATLKEKGIPQSSVPQLHLGRTLTSRMPCSSSVTLSLMDLGWIVCTLLLKDHVHGVLVFFFFSPKWVIMRCFEN